LTLKVTRLALTLLTSPKTVAKIISSQTARVLILRCKYM